MSNDMDMIGPRIGVYFGVIIDQDHLDNKIDPIEIASKVEQITGISPFDIKALWKIDYDRSQSYRTIIVYHTQYTRRTKCPGYIGGWCANGNTKNVPEEIYEEADKISCAIEKDLYPRIENNTCYAIMAVGYSTLYLIG
jgi:hypothetical protein